MQLVGVDGALRRKESSGQVRHPPLKVKDSPASQGGTSTYIVGR